MSKSKAFLIIASFIMVGVVIYFGCIHLFSNYAYTHDKTPIETITGDSSSHIGSTSYSNVSSSSEDNSIDLSELADSLNSYKTELDVTYEYSSVAGTITIHLNSIESDSYNILNIVKENGILYIRDSLSYEYVDEGDGLFGIFMLSDYNNTDNLCKDIDQAVADYENTNIPKNATDAYEDGDSVQMVKGADGNWYPASN